jgi:osmotically-inducible protein OsmY
MIMAATRNRSGQMRDVLGLGMENGPATEAIVQARFSRSPYLPLRKITCHLNDGMLVLRGRVPTFYLKQLAQTISHSFGSIRQVINELEVDLPGQNRS